MFVRILKIDKHKSVKKKLFRKGLGFCLAEVDVVFCLLHISTSRVEIKFHTKLDLLHTCRLCILTLLWVGVWDWMVGMCWMGFQANVVANNNGVIISLFFPSILHFFMFLQEHFILGLWIYKFKYHSKTFGQHQDILLFLIFYYLYLMH